MAERNLIVIGGSAGALSALRTVLPALPGDLPAAMVVVIHTRADGLARTLQRASALPVVVAADHEPIEDGRIYVAPPDRHVLVSASSLRVVRGPRENGFRPAIDPLFRSASRLAGVKVLGILFSGALDDGSAGLSAIVRRGGAAIVQDPQDAEVPNMPLAALKRTEVEQVLPAARIAAAVQRFCGHAADEVIDVSTSPEQPEPQERGGDIDVAAMEQRLGPPSPITCPACGGALWETEQDGGRRFACHVGHQYNPESLVANHGEAVEQALWTAVRILEQHADLQRRMARRAETAGMQVVAQGFAEEAEEYHRQARDVRRLVVGEGLGMPRKGALRRKAGAE